MSLLRIVELHHEFGGVVAIEDLSFVVEAGAIFSMIGPNGAGKTTLLNLISGVYRPSGGRIFLGEQEITGLPPYALAESGVSRTFQTPQVFFNMTALENVMVGRHRHSDTRLSAALLRLGGLAAAERRDREAAALLMGQLGLADYRDAESDTLPYGALKRLEIARAMASRPRLLLLDEPAAGLNPVETSALERLIREIAKSGVTVVLVEHNMPMVMRLSDRILVLNHGRKLIEGDAETVRCDHQVIAAYLGSGAAAQRMAIDA